MVGEADGFEDGRAEDAASVAFADADRFPVGRKEFEMAVGDEFASGGAPVGAAVKSVLAHFEVHDPAVSFAVGINVFVAGHIGMTDVEGKSGEAASQAAEERFEVFDECFERGAIDVLEAVGVGEKAEGRQLDETVQGSEAEGEEESLARFEDED